MFNIDAFTRKLKQDNPHYERFIKSDLHDLVGLLNRKMPAPTAHEVDTAMKNVSAAKWQKYRNVHSYLVSTFNLRTQAAAAQGIGPSVPGYQPGKWVRATDEDGRWHSYVLQQKGNSCGPACVAMVKRAFYPQSSHQINENFIRGMVALAEKGRLHEGVSALSRIALRAHDWRNAGSDNDGLIAVLRAQPCRVPKARDAGGMSPDALLTELRKCTPGKPSIVGWMWSGGGGHWTVCAGPTKNNSKLLILDPWEGVQYVPNDVNSFTTYMGDGTLDFGDPILTT